MEHVVWLSAVCGTLLDHNPIKVSLPFGLGCLPGDLRDPGLFSLQVLGIQNSPSLLLGILTLLERVRRAIRRKHRSAPADGLFLSSPSTRGAGHSHPAAGSHQLLRAPHNIVPAS